MAGHRSVAKVESRRELLVEGKVEEETLAAGRRQADRPRGAQPLGRRNGLIDECRIRSAHAPANFATISVNLLRRSGSTGVNGSYRALDHT